MGGKKFVGGTRGSCCGFVWVVEVQWGLLEIHWGVYWVN